MAKPRDLNLVLEAVRTRFGPVAAPGNLARAIAKERDELGVPRSLSAAGALRRLVAAGSLQELSLRSVKYGSLRRLAVPEADLFDVALSMKTDAYFCHGTAVFLLGLSNEVPTTLYVNREQSPKRPPAGELGQAALDRAFANKGRRSAFSFRAVPVKEVEVDLAVAGDDAELMSGTTALARQPSGPDLGEVTLLSGKHTDGLEVGTALTPRGRSVPTTKLERTLIDIAVRPDYAGGPSRVAAAYEQAVKRGISSNVLLATLTKLDYKYPYHQAIGYYLDRAGADGKLLDRLRSLGFSLDFYLNYGMKKRQLNQAWRIYVPEGM